MLPTGKLSLVSRLLLIWLTIRRFSAAQMYYEDEPCDFGIYKGICLRASNCLELPVLMKEMSLKSADVGHCGFTATEEIICCPQAPTPVARELPNKLEDILKPFEFRAPPEDETTTRTIQPLPADFWFSNNLKESNRDESASKSDGGSTPVRRPKVDDSARVNVILNGNQSLNQRPLSEGDVNEETVRRLKDIFNTKPIPQGPLNGNSAPSSLPNADDTQRIDAIFNMNPVPSENTPIDNTQRINAIFNEQLIPIGNKVNDIDANVVDQTQQFDSIFNGNPTASGAPFGSIDSDTAQRITAIFNTNTAPSGIPIEDNTQVIDGSQVPLGNINNNNTQGVKVILNNNPLPNGTPIEVSTPKMNGISAPVSWPNAADSQNIPAMIDTIFNASPAFTGDDVTRRINSIFNTNPVPNPTPFEGNAQRLNAIFYGNPVQTGSQISNDLFHNFLKQPRNQGLPANREIFNMPVQQPPLPLANRFLPQFGRLEQQ